MKRVGVIGILVLLSLGGGMAASADTDHCYFGDATIDAAECQSLADAAWEGLDSDMQRSIEATGLHGTAVDQLTVNVRDAIADGMNLVTIENDGGHYSVYGQRIMEDDPRWDCHKMGNHICGPVNVPTELPHTL